MSILEIVSLKVKSLAIVESDIRIAIDEIEDVIKNYCNIKEVPEALKYTWANMTVDLVRYQYTMDMGEDNDLDDINLSDISNLKIGDTQISLQGNNSIKSRILKGHYPNLDNIVLNYRNQLNKFRRMVW